MMIIEACSLLEDSIKSKIEIIFTGLDKQYIRFVNDLEKKAKQNKLDIKILRFDDMAEVYKVADIAVLPSKSESFGYSALESLSLGIPTILNNIPTFNEIVEGNKNYIIFNSTAEELKNDIVYMIENNIYGKRELPDDEWIEKYNIHSFSKKYLEVMQ